MSYYERSSFRFTDHAITRAKQRIANLANESSLMIQTKILELLRQTPAPEFIDHKYKYFRIHWQNPKYLYIVATKDTNVIVTITTISELKKINLFTNI